MVSTYAELGANPLTGEIASVSPRHDERTEVAGDSRSAACVAVWSSGCENVSWTGAFGSADSAPALALCAATLTVVDRCAHGPATTRRAAAITAAATVPVHAIRRR